MSMVQDFAKIEARKYGLRVFFRETVEFPGQQTYGIEAFEGFELVALPDGRVLDAVPLDAITVPGMTRGMFELLETFA